MNQNLVNFKKKEVAIKHYFEDYNQSMKDLIMAGEDVNCLLFHDFLKDLKGEEIAAIRKSNGPSLARLRVLNAIYAVSTLSDEDRRLVKETFIRPNNPNWWKEYYTRSNYYRTRHRVVETFYELIN